MNLSEKWILSQAGPGAASAPSTPPAPLRAARLSAFTLVEVMFSVVIVGVLVVALYSALASAVPMVRSGMENERVTQILSEKLDTIRLYNWTQITNLDRFVPTNFIALRDPLQPDSAPYYTGTIAIAEAPITEGYRSNLLQVMVRVNWVSGSRPQSRILRCIHGQVFRRRLDAPEGLLSATRRGDRVRAHRGSHDRQGNTPSEPAIALARFRQYEISQRQSSQRCRFVHLRSDS